MSDIFNMAYLMAATGDKSKPLLVAICLIISIVLIVILIITGKMMSNSDEDEAVDEKERDE